MLSPGRINIVMASDHAALNSLDDSLTELGDGAAGSDGTTIKQKRGVLAHLLHCALVARQLLQCLCHHKPPFLLL